jgi:hypothetical protein
MKEFFGGPGVATLPAKALFRVLVVGMHCAIVLGEHHKNPTSSRGLFFMPLIVRSLSRSNLASQVSKRYGVLLRLVLITGYLYIPSTLTADKILWKNFRWPISSTLTKS